MWFLCIPSAGVPCPWAPASWRAVEMPLSVMVWHQQCCFLQCQICFTAASTSLLPSRGAAHHHSSMLLFCFSIWLFLCSKVAPGYDLICLKAILLFNIIRWGSSHARQFWVCHACSLHSHLRVITLARVVCDGGDPLSQEKYREDGADFFWMVRKWKMMAINTQEILIWHVEKLLSLGSCGAHKRRSLKIPKILLKKFLSKLI